MTTLRIQSDAQEQADAADDWWRENRPAAPNRFIEEFDAALDELLRVPDLWPFAGLNEVPSARRRVLLVTGYAVYYCYDPKADHVDVIAVWSTRRGRGPF